MVPLDAASLATVGGILFVAISGVVIIVRAFLAHMKNRDAIMQSIAGKFDRTVLETHAETRQMVGTLFTLQRETINALGEMKEEIRSLREKVEAQ